MSRRGLGTRGFIMLAMMVLAVVGWLYVSRRGQGREAAAGSVLDAVPSEAMLIVVVDMKALRATELGQRLLGQGRSIAGLGEVRTLCGADPMDLVEQLAVVVPEATELGGFGVFATGAFDADKFLRCAELIIRKRGGKPVRQPRHGFAVLRDTNLSLSSAELAVSDGGPLILGEPAYVSAGLKAARAGRSDRNAAHTALRDLVQSGGVAVATVVLSREQRATLIDELRNQNMVDSPFAAVTAGALSVRLDSELHAHAVLQCGRPAACKAIAEIIDSERIEEAETLTAQAVGLSKVLQGVSVKADQTAVHLRSSIAVDEALTLLRRVLALRKLGRQLEQPAAPVPLPADAGVLVVPSASPGAASAQPPRRGPTGSALPRPAKPTPSPGSPAPAGSAQ